MGFFAVKIEGGAPPVEVPGVDPVVGLSRPIQSRKGQPPCFQIAEPFGYHDVRTGDSIVVPVNEETSDTDLASVPSWLGWLAPKTGKNLPAALLHDVLIVGASKKSAKRADKGPCRGEEVVNHWVKHAGDPNYVAASAVHDRISSDLMFRDAMRDAEVFLFRRWVMWAGVSLPTLLGSLAAGWRRWVGRGAAVLLALVGGFAGIALPPNVLFDVADAEWWFMPFEFLGTGEGSALAEIGQWLLVLAGLWAAAALLFGFGLRPAGHPMFRESDAEGRHRRPATHWQVGILFVPALFLLGWPSLISASWAGLYWLIQSSVSVFDTPFDREPDDRVAMEGEKATFAAAPRLDAGQTIQWVRQEADGSMVDLAGATDVVLEVEALEEYEGARFIAEIRDAEGEKVAQSKRARLTVQTRS